MAKRGLSIEEIKRQSGHDDIETLLGYIQLSDEEVRDAYLKGISFNEPDVKETKRELPKPVKQSTQQLQNQTEDKFFQLLRDGLITPEQYKELVSKNNIYGYS